MRLVLFFKLMIISLCLSLLAFALLAFSPMEALRIMAIGTVVSIGVTKLYPDLRGVRKGDVVAVVADSATPSIIGRFGTAAMHGKKNDQIKIIFQNGTEVVGVVEGYPGIISPARIRAIYEERMVE